MDECPVCLEPLVGTIVQLGCCKNHVHIQCYLPKCPLCRADLPAPRAVHTIIPIQLPQPQSRWQFVFIPVAVILGGGLIFIYGLVAKGG
jgi:hypothetical protein